MEDFKNSFIGSNLAAPIFKKWICFCYNLGDVVVTPTEYSRKLLEGYGLKRKIYSITNGVDTEFFKPDPEGENTLPRKISANGRAEGCDICGTFDWKKRNSGFS